MKIRTTKPEKGNKYYIKKSSGGYSPCITGDPQDPNCDVLANCVGYAVGRFNEESSEGRIKYLDSMTPENLWKNYKKWKLERGQEPKQGSAMIWSKGSPDTSEDGSGHIAIVEKVMNKTAVYTSESGYKKYIFKNKTRTKSKGNWGSGDEYQFLGFLYNPVIDRENEISYIQRTLNNKYNTKLVINGIYDDKTHKVLIIGLQTELNQEYNANLKVDGIFGPKTKLACPNIRKGSKGNIVWLIQASLECQYYDIGSSGCDSKFGKATDKAVREFQMNRGLKVDGIVGKNTFEKMFK